MRRKQFGDKRVFRAYHKAVWRRVWSKAWMAAIWIPFYGISACTWVDHEWVWLYVLLTVGFAWIVAHRAGRSYAEMDFHLMIENRKAHMLKEMREHLIKEGATEEEADMKVWQLQLEIE